MPHTHSYAAIPLRGPILAATSEAYQTIAAIKLLAPQIPQLRSLQIRQSSALVCMYNAYAEVCAGTLPLPTAEAIISGVAREIDEIAEEVDDYIIFWSDGGDMVTDGVALGRSFVRHEGDLGALERVRKRILVEEIITGVRDGMGAQEWRGADPGKEEGSGGEEGK